MIKLIATDLDGTLMDKDNSISTNNYEAIKAINNKNINFAICTGKTYPIIKDVCSKINAKYGIFGNGNLIVDLQTGKEIYKNLLSISDVNSCINIAKKHNLHIHIYTENKVITQKLLYMDLRNYTLQRNELSKNSLEYLEVTDLKDYISKNNINIYKLVISSTYDISNVKTEIINETNLSVMQVKKYGEYKDSIINKEYEYLDISPKNIDKSNALEVLSNYLNVDTSEIMAIGDNINDLNMVKNSGVGIAVANAYDELKQVAKYTTTSNAKNGAFAEAVYKYIEF